MPHRRRGALEEDSPVERFTASREVALCGLIAVGIKRGGSRGGRDAAARDTEGRRSLAPRSATPVHGVRNPDLERNPDDYFQARRLKGPGRFRTVAGKALVQYCGHILFSGV